MPLLEEETAAPGALIWRKTLKTIEKTYEFKLSIGQRNNLKKILIVGCGGNGSHIVSDIARLVASLKSGIEIVLVDGDVVEEKNLIRQHFVSSDLGSNKAEALARRYSSAYGVDISFIPEYLTEANKATVLNSIYSAYGTQLIITCTDNLASRKIISDVENVVWIDLGNEEFGGQVTFTSLISNLWGTRRFGEESHFPTPSVFDLFPEYSKRLMEETPIEVRSCAEIAEESPNQAGFVNVMTAGIAKNYVHSLLTGRGIRTYQVFFSVDNTFEHRSITHSTVLRWKEQFPVKFASYRIS